MQNLTVQQLETHIEGGRPVILLIQAWADLPVDYKNDFDDGHYVVLIGSDSKYFYFEDPWIIGSLAYISKINFLDRWHASIDVASRKYFNTGIVFRM